MRLGDVQRDWAVFAHEGEVALGAVRRVAPDHLLVYVEGYGDVAIAEDQIAAIHDEKVVIDPERLSPEVRAAMSHAHDREGDGPA